MKRNNNNVELRSKIDLMQKLGFTDEEIIKDLKKYGTN